MSTKEVTTESWWYAPTAPVGFCRFARAFLRLDPVRSCGRFSGRAAAELCVFLLYVAASGERSDAQQPASAWRAATQRVVVAEVSTPVGQILLVQPVGDPVSLSDGRIEQRYRVVANVAFTLSVADPGHDALTWTQGGDEAPLFTYNGVPGFHSAVRVRSSGPTPPKLSAQARSTPSQHATALRR